MAPAGFVVAASISLDFGPADAAARAAVFSLGAGEVTAAYSNPEREGQERGWERTGGERTAVRDGQDYVYIWAYIYVEIIQNNSPCLLGCNFGSRV